LKTINLLSSSVLAAFLTAGFQAYANSLTFTETIPNINYEIEGVTYNGTFTDGSLKSGSTVFNNTQETISSATVALTISNDTSLPVTLTIDGVSANLTPTSSPQTLDFSLTSKQYDYIQSQDGTFNFGVVVDCELDSAELIVNTTSPQGQTSAPDGGCTAMLLGGIVLGFGLIKRKMS